MREEKNDLVTIAIKCSYKVKFLIDHDFKMSFDS